MKLLPAPPERIGQVEALRQSHRSSVDIFVLTSGLLFEEVLVRFPTGGRSRPLSLFSPTQGSRMREGHEKQLLL